MMYFIGKNGLVKIIILTEYRLYMMKTNIISRKYFTVNTTEQDYLVNYYNVIYVRL